MNIGDIITSLPELISRAVEANQWFGYSLILIAMFLENIFPPIPSELIMPLGGFYIYTGDLNFLPVILAGLIGTLLGAFPWYGIGRLVNQKKLENWLSKNGRWIGISPNDLYRSQSWFNKYGNYLVFWGRLIPGIRTLISVPAGIELMPIIPFTICTTAGSLIWVVFLTVSGILLGESYSIVQEWIEPFSRVIKYILALGLLSITALLFLRALGVQKRD